MLKKFFAYCLVLLISLSLTACTQSHKNDIEDDIECFIQATYYCNASKDILLELAPEKYWQKWSNEENFSNLDSFFSNLDDEAKKIRERHKNELISQTVSYEITKKEKLSHEETKKVLFDLGNKHNLNYGVAEEGYELDINITIKSPEDTNVDSYNFFALKIDDNWYFAAAVDSNLYWLIDIII